MEGALLYGHGFERYFLSVLIVVHQVSLEGETNHYADR
jgi:hypothetical protein